MLKTTSNVLLSKVTSVNGEYWRALLVAPALFLAACGGSAENVATPQPELGVTPKQASCTVTVRPGPGAGDRLTEAVNDHHGATICVEAKADGSDHTYLVSETLDLDGDVLLGELGTVTKRGPAYDPDPRVHITATEDSDLTRIVNVSGSAVLEWVGVHGAEGGYVEGWEPGDDCPNPGVDDTNCPRAGTGTALSMGQANGRARVRFAELSRNEATGITGARGVIFRSDVSFNATNPDFVGFTAAGIKGVNEYEVHESYVNDNTANGVWCDSNCTHDPLRQHGYWVHDSLIVKNGRWGVRYENSPQDAGEKHVLNITALVENNEIHQNGGVDDNGGVSVHDAQNITVRANAFGTKRVGGVGYGPSANNIAVRFVTEQKRTKMFNNKAHDNALDGKVLKGCGLPDNQVDCVGYPGN